MKVGYLQFNPEFGNPKRNLKRIKELISGIDFDLIVIPELANSGYLFTSLDEVKSLSEKIPEGDYCKALREISISRKAYIVSGICERKGDLYYNSSVLISPGGQIHTYRKIHLFYEEKLWFTPGNLPFTVYEINGHAFGKVKIGMMVCYDWIYPEVTRTLSLRGAQIICHPSNLVMPYCQDAMVTRALENGVFTITANRIGKEIRKKKELVFTGMSEIVNPRGKILHRSPSDVEEVFITDIDPSESNDKNINAMNNLVKDRREEYYYK
jgi:predicted amidohydrolase